MARYKGDMSPKPTPARRAALAAIAAVTRRGVRNPDALRLAEAVATDADAAHQVAPGAAGATCRHCGGPVPCSSPFGDVRPGIRRPHSDAAQ